MLEKITEYEIKLEIKRDFRRINHIIQSSEDLSELISKLFDREDREKLYVILLDARKKILGINLISVGTADSILIHPREVFKPAILIGASGIILVHNHPSRNVSPSTSDIEMTDRIIESGSILDILVLDHIIYGGDSIYSMNEKCEYFL